MMQLRHPQKKKNKKNPTGLECAPQQTEYFSDVNRWRILIIRVSSFLVGSSYEMMREKYCLCLCLSLSLSLSHTHMHKRAAELMKWKRPVITQVMTAEGADIALAYLW